MSCVLLVDTLETFVVIVDVVSVEVDMDVSDTIELAVNGPFNVVE